MTKSIHAISMIALASSLFISGIASAVVIAVKDKRGDMRMVTHSSQITFEELKDSYGLCYVAESKAEVVKFVRESMKRHNDSGGGDWKRFYNIKEVSNAYDSGVYKNIYWFQLSSNQDNQFTQPESIYIHQCN